MQTDHTKITTGLKSPAVTIAAAAAATLGVPMTASSASSDCDDDVVCIHETREDGRIQVLAENRGEFPVTVTVRVKSSNLESKGPRKVTRTVPAGKSTVAFDMSPADSPQPPRYRYFYDWTIGDSDAVHDDEQLYLLPYAPGQSYRVIQGFGSRFSHTGLEQYAIDFRMPEGTPIHAARSGVVARTEERHSIGCWRDGCGKYANFVVVLHDDGTTGEYYHLQQNGALVEVGEQVQAGQLIALSGNTGHTTIPHLHFAVYRAVEWGNTQSVPVRFLSEDGIVDPPRRGGRYQATGHARISQHGAGDPELLNSDASD